MTSSSVETPWTTPLSDIAVNSFTSHTGPNVAIPDTPIEVFQLFYTDQIFEEMVFQTNEYAKEIMDAEKFEKWKPICLKDLKAFFGVTTVCTGLSDVYQRCGIHKNYWITTKFNKCF